MAGGAVRPDQRPRLEAWARLWATWAGAAFLRAYLEAASAARFLPRTRGELTVLLDAYMLEKAIYEVGYELSRRPEWVAFPLAGILEMLGAGPAGA